MHRDELPVSEPCHADWSAMTGGTARRFCGSCTRHVHDLSAMTAPAAKRLVAEEPNLCVRYAVDPAGRVLHASPQRLGRWLALGAALVGATPALASGMVAAPASRSPEPGWMDRILQRVEEAIGITPEAVPPEPPVVMGEMAPPSPPPPMVLGRMVRPPTLSTPIRSTVIPEVEDEVVGASQIR